MHEIIAIIPCEALRITAIATACSFISLVAPVGNVVIIMAASSAFKLRNAS